MLNEDLKPVKVLVTGGAGFIGSHLTTELLGMGYRVTVVDDLSTGSLDNLEHLSSDSDLEVLCFSVNDVELLKKACEGATYLFHQAAIPSVPRSVSDPVSTNHANINGTLNVLVGARDAGVKKVVYASSSSVYGDTPTLPKVEDMLPCPRSPYAVSKLAGENYCAAFTTSYGLATASLRYFNVYGPRQAADSDYAAVIPKFISLIKQGKPPQIYGDGTQTRDFTFVKDVVRANILAAQSNQVGAYNIGSSSSISLNELCSRMLNIMGRNDLSPVYAQPRPGDVAHSLADISHSKMAFGYSPLYSLEEGLKITIEDYGE